MATLGTGDKKETTEWDDILRSKGILPEMTPEELAQKTLEAVVEQTVDSFDPHAHKDVSQLDDDLEDADSDDERILAEYRARRIQQMKTLASTPRFGPGVAYVSAADWKREVTEMGGDVHVVVHLFQQSVEGCKLMDARLLGLSGKFPFTKFVKCKASDAIKNYPDARCPTILVYKGGKVLKQFVGLAAFEGNKTTEADIEWRLSKTGAVETEMVEAPSEDSRRFNITRI